jgi:hypothetical protein
MKVSNICIAGLLFVQATLGAAVAQANNSDVLRPKARQNAAVITALGLEVADAVEVEEAAIQAGPKSPSLVFEAGFRPPARKGQIPRTRWQHMDGHAVWTRSALSALKTHGKPLVELVPADIETWCPAYERATDANRRAFWVGFMSSLAKHESTYKPWAVGGGGKWYGLLQILPATARGYKCNVGTGEALKNGAANLSCAVRIMAHTVPRDGVIHGYVNRKGRGVTADWGPMHSAAKRRDMAGWLRQQSYCTSVNTVRPKLRP